MSYSQYSEDVIVDGILGYPPMGLIVDIGAGDGKHLSNSLLFRERGWEAVLVEADPEHWEALGRLSEPLTWVWEGTASPENINALVLDGAKVLSIDVDGDDYFLLEALEARPAVIIIEHNPTMPYRMDVHPARPGLQVGASVAALTRLAEDRGYGLAAVTHCNAIFEYRTRSLPIPAWEPAYAVATEYFSGRPIVLGTPPWGVDFENPYPSGDVVVR